MKTTPRFKAVDDIIETFKKAGYEELKSVDPDEDVFLRKALRGDDILGDVNVRIWKSNYSPTVEIKFPNVIHRDDLSSQKNVSINYVTRDDGLALLNVYSDTKRWLTLKSKQVLIR